jgi:hypothetical protein
MLETSPDGVSFESEAVTDLGMDLEAQFEDLFSDRYL